MSRIHGTAKGRPREQAVGYVCHSLCVPRPPDEGPLNVPSKAKHVSSAEGAERGWEACLEFPDVYKARRSMWQVTGRWGGLRSLAPKSPHPTPPPPPPAPPLYILACLPGPRRAVSKGKGTRRDPNEYPAPIRVLVTMVKSTWSENLKDNTQLQPGFRGRPARRSFGVCPSEGLERPACLFTWTVFSSFGWRPPSQVCGCVFLLLHVV